jgi:hypothetical protein
MGKGFNQERRRVGRNIVGWFEDTSVADSFLPRGALDPEKGRFDANCNLQGEGSAQLSKQSPCSAVELDYFFYPKTL